MVTCTVLAAHLKENPFEPEDLGLVVRLEVVQVLCVDQVQATAQQLRLEQECFGLLPDLGEGLLDLHGIVPIHAADDELRGLWAFMLACNPAQPIAQQGRSPTCCQDFVSNLYGHNTADYPTSTVYNVMRRIATLTEILIFRFFSKNCRYAVCNRVSLHSHYPVWLQGMKPFKKRIVIPRKASTFEDLRQCL